MHDDPYIPEEVLGTGPSGKVYRGHDVAGSSLVRIKALLTSNEVGCPVDKACLRALVPALLHLQHPQVCRLIALDENADDIALVTELSQGEPINVLLTQRGFSALDIRALASQLVLALQAGEMLGLRHGDVKPSNVMISDQGGGCVLQLQDWGLSECRHPQPNETLCFRAPERLHGAPASAQSDLFSAGATLATLMLGRQPVQGEGVEQLFAAWASFDPMLLRHARPDVDPAFQDWLSWLLRFDSAYRPVSAFQAQEMLAAGAMMSAYSMPMMPMYQPPVIPTEAPLEESPRPDTTSLGPRAPTPRPPTGLLGAAKPELAAPVKRKRQIPFGILFSLLSLATILGFLGWLMVQWGPEWPDHLRKLVVETMGGSVEPEAEPAKMPSGPSPLKGRFVRVQLPGRGTLNLAEVEVFSMGRNISPEGTASAKDSAWGTDAKLANDGNTSGDWSHKSIYHSKDRSTSPWWEVDLGSDQIIDAVKLWNRTEDKYEQRLNDYSVIVLDSARKEVWRADNQPAPRPSMRHELK